MVRSTLLFALLSMIAGIASGFELTMSSAAPTRRAWLGKAAAAPAAAAGVVWSAAAPTALADENDRRLGKRPRDEDGNLVKGGVTANGPINVNRAAAPDYMVQSRCVVASPVSRDEVNGTRCRRSPPHTHEAQRDTAAAVHGTTTPASTPPTIFKW